MQEGAMNRRLFTSRLLVMGLVSTSLMWTGCSATPRSKAQMVADAAEPVAMPPELKVFRSPNCGCCGRWIQHMEAAGFQVQDNVTEDMAAIKQQYGVPESLASCHTAIVEGYVVEGHIPATDVQRLLTEKPAVAGIAAPGMPMGSPGMESGNEVEPYTVFSFTEVGDTAAFAEHS